MATNVSKEQAASARCADLYDFLVQYYDFNFKHEGDSIRPVVAKSVSTTEFCKISFHVNEYNIVLGFFLI